MINTDKNYSIKSILEEVSEAQILAFFFNVNRLPCIINSPLREDRNPSFGFFSKNGKKIRYRDFATGESGGVFDLLVSFLKKPLTDVLKIIASNIKEIKDSEIKDFKGGNVEDDNNYSTLRDRPKVDLQVKLRNYEAKDLNYWKSYGVSEDTLKWANVYPISHILITKNKYRYIFPAEENAYVYIEYKDDIPSFKVYQPYSKSRKWINGHDSSVWDLWEKIPKKGKYLIITSSRKDAMCIIENLKIPALALQGEGYIPKKKVMDELKARYANIFILYDNDMNNKINNGQILGHKLASLFRLKTLTIPDQFRAKDPSDLYRLRGKQVLKDLIYNQIKKQTV